MKKFALLLLLAIFTLSIQSVIFATGIAGSVTIGNGDGVTATDLTGPTGQIIGAIQVVGYLIAAGMIVYIGVKYIMASASEKADLKGLAIKYVIGAILIIFGVTIADWIFSIQA